MLSPARVLVAGAWTRENAGLVRLGMGLVLGLRDGLGGELADGDGHALSPEPVGDDDTTCVIPGAVGLAGWPAAAWACAGKETRASVGARTNTAQTDRRPALISHRPLVGHRSRRPRWKQALGRCEAGR
jgi:hypothetical protein